MIEPSPSPAPANSTASPARNRGRYCLARLGDRFIAFALDTALLFGVFAVVDAWAFMRWGVVAGSELQLTAASLLIALTLNAAILFLYGWLLEAAFGATLGKALVGIRIVRTSGRGPLAASALRNVLRTLDGLGLYLVGTAVAACSNLRQRVGDIVAHTAVIQESFGLGIRAAAIVIWVATLAGAWWAVPRLCATCNREHPRYLGQVVVRVGTTGNSAYLTIAGFTVDVSSTKP